MSLTMFVCVAASAAAIGWVTGKRARERHEEATVRAPSPEEELAPNPFALFGYGLRDVLIRTRDDEALLSGGYRMKEGSQVSAAVFVGPGARGVTRVVVAFAAERDDLLWLELLPEGAVEVGREPATTLLINDEPYERSRRLPVAVERFGEGLPAIDDEVTLYEYGSAEGRSALVLRGGKHTIVAKGTKVLASTLDRLPGA